MIYPKDTGDGWQSISSVVDRLKRKVEQAILAGNSEVAESYHNRLIDAEHLQRQEREE